MSAIKCVLFDLDGVLVKTKDLHYEALNRILKLFGEQYVISREDHFVQFDGLSTRKKLKMLSEQRGLPESNHEEIWKLKQKLTAEMLEDVILSPNIYSLFVHLKDNGYKLGMCSNAISNTVELILTKLHLIDFFDVILSNEDVKNPKPHPEIYHKALSILGMNPEESVIIEDSPNGIRSAFYGSPNVIRVDSPEDLSISKIMNKIKTLPEYPRPKWKDDSLNVLIPMAGNGSRFSEVGYTNPKPLIDVKGSPMIKLVVNSIGIDANFIFIVKESHAKEHNLDLVLPLIAPNCKIVKIGDETTEGAACTALLAKDLIDNKNPLIIANSDQYVVYDSLNFMYKAKEQDVDGSILTFKANHPKWSYAKKEHGLVTEVAEKNPISDDATVGIYYYKHGEDFVKYSEQMISNNIRVNNEFYICPVFNEYIKDGKRITTFQVEEMHGLGTPEDLNIFLNK